MNLHEWENFAAVVKIIDSFVKVQHLIILHHLSNLQYEDNVKRREV